VGDLKLSTFRVVFTLCYYEKSAQKPCQVARHLVLTAFLINLGIYAAMLFIEYFSEIFDKQPSSSV
jgi:hypothetical protein